MDDFKLVYNERTRQWERQKEPFATILVETEEEFNFIQEAITEKRLREKGKTNNEKI